MPANDMKSPKYPPNKYSYISSSYVKWIQASGARVIPIQYDLPEEEQYDLLKRVNGVFITGGDTSLWIEEENRTGFSNFTQAGYRLFQKAVEINKNGTYFPFMGTCLGYEAIMISMTNNEKFLNKLNSSSHTLNTVLHHSISSKQYSTLTKQQLFSIQNQEAFYYNHNQGVTLDSFLKTEVLQSMFKLTAYAKDNNGVSFVSSLEGKDYPIYLNQFHPEKNSYEWLNSVHANHSPQAIETAQAIANFFVNEARQNKNLMSDEEMQAFNVENYQLKTVYQNLVSGYIFKNQNYTNANVQPSKQQKKQKNKLNKKK